MMVLIAGCSENRTVYDIVWQDFNNQKVQLKEYKGKWVIVNYWATWCIPCIKEMPILEDYYQQSNGAVVVLGANIEHADGFVSPQAIVGFVERLNLTFPIVKANIKLDKVSLGKIKALPMTVIINPQGKVVYTHLGEVTPAILNQHIKK